MLSTPFPWPLGLLAPLFLFGCWGEPDVLTPPIATNEVYPKYPVLEWDATPPPAPVKSTLLVNVEGKVADITWLSGSELLRPHVEVALLKWRFKPAELGGDPVEGNFEFAYDMTPPEVIPRRPVPVPKIMHRIQPTFPRLDNTDAIDRQEAVMRISIDETGRVKEADWVSGPEPLRAPYLKAVKQWRFEAVSLPPGEDLYTFEQTLVYRFD